MDENETMHHQQAIKESLVMISAPVGYSQLL